MATFTRYEPKSERELHSIIEKELDALEEGLALLKYELGLEKGIPDFLCVDSGGRLVIIEVKLKEDENILFQALKYYNELTFLKYPFNQEIIGVEELETNENAL
jgi:RecB family endonuclease NucS